MHTIRRAKCMRKITCEVFLSTPPVGYSGSPSTVNETNCNKKNSHEQKKSYELISNSFQTCHTTMCLKGCHVLCCPGERSSSTCSPDSRWRRFLIETAARISDRSLTSPFLPDLCKVRYHCLLFSSEVRRYVWYFFATSSHYLHSCSVQPIASCDSR